MALILRESDVQDLIEMDEVIASLEQAMRELGEGEAQNEPRRRAFAPDGLLNVLFASYPGGKCTGLKAYTVSNGRVRFRARHIGTVSEGLPSGSGRCPRCSRWGAVRSPGAPASGRR